MCGEYEKQLRIPSTRRHDKTAKKEAAERTEVECHTRISSDELIARGARYCKPHVVILGAGASVAATPFGDANHKRLPLMRNFVETLGLAELLLEINPELRRDTAKFFEWVRDFEACYSALAADGTPKVQLQRLEEAVFGYFNNLRLPPYATLYDRLVLSLREGDAILTFNWDPLLVEAWQRNSQVAQGLPKLFFLHGNVAVAHCTSCQAAYHLPDRNKGLGKSGCKGCGASLQRSKLLYPVAEKNYAQDPFIKAQWDGALAVLREALMCTVIGYSAPTTDAEAKRLLDEAWKTHENGMELLRHVQIVDVRHGDDVSHSWHEFSHHMHYDIDKSIEGTYLGNYPRRSQEALVANRWDSRFVQAFPPRQTLADLQGQIEPEDTDCGVCEVGVVE